MQEARRQTEPKRQARHSSGKGKLVLRQTCRLFKNNYGVLKRTEYEVNVTRLDQARQGLNRTGHPGAGKEAWV